MGRKRREQREYEPFHVEIPEGEGPVDERLKGVFLLILVVVFIVGVYFNESETKIEPKSDPVSLSEGTYFAPAEKWVPKPSETGSGYAWGFVDGRTWVLPPRYEEARPFRTVLYSTVRGAGCITIAQTRIGGKIGFIDVQGRYCVVPRYDETLGFGDRWAAVREGTKWGYINSVGEIMIQPRFELAFPYNDMDMKKGRALVKIDGAFHIIDREGMVADDCPIPDFNKGPLAMGLAGEYTFLDSLASEPFKERFAFASQFSCGRARVIPLGGNLYGYIDATGTMVIPPIFAEATDFKNGVAFGIHARSLFDGAPSRVFDVDGKDLLPPHAKGALSNTLIPVKVGAVWGYVDHTGEMVIQPRFEQAGGFNDGQALVKGRRGEEGGVATWFMIDRTGKYLYETTPIAESQVLPAEALHQNKD